MHVGNIEWLQDLSHRYRTRYKTVMELGSLDMNGTARDYMRAASWIGVDRIDGDAVDIHCAAAETRFIAEQFDVILCTSMLEHDPTWRESLSHNLQWLRPGGHLFLSWGAEGNVHHEPEPFKEVPVADVVAWAGAEGMEILESHWEGERYRDDCKGCYDMVLKRPGEVEAPGPAASSSQDHVRLMKTSTLVARLADAMGRGEWLNAEADELDRRLPPRFRP